MNHIIASVAGEFSKTQAAFMDDWTFNIQGAPKTHPARPKNGVKIAMPGYIRQKVIPMVRRLSMGVRTCTNMAITSIKSNAIRHANAKKVEEETLFARRFTMMLVSQNP